VKKIFREDFGTVFGRVQERMDRGKGLKHPAWLIRPAPEPLAISRMEKKLRSWGW
jgi:hypothetical protein